MEDSKNVNYKDIVGKEFKLILNDDYYKKNGDFFTTKANSDNLIDLYNNDNAKTVKIAGVLRSSEDSKLEILSPGLFYSDDLAEYFIDDAKNSEIVKAQKDTEFNILTGQPFGEETSSTGMQSSGADQMMTMGNSVVNAQAPTKDQVLSQLGANSTPFSITIYPKDFTTKDDILSYLNKWNNGKDVEDSILYTDLVYRFIRWDNGLNNTCPNCLCIDLASCIINYDRYNYLYISTRENKGNWCT